MNTISLAAACVTGARHLRAARNGQDACATWRGGDGEDAAAVVVCDGCGSGGSSEVGARLGAQLFVAALGRRLAAAGGGAPEGGDGRDVREDGHGSARGAGGARLQRAFEEARAEVGRTVEQLAALMPGERSDVLREHFLFTLVAAACTPDGAAVWAVGDGAYALDGATRVLGPFADNEPPYLAYDLLGAPARAHFEATEARAIVIATDGAELVELARFAALRYATHPDALRRELAVLARSGERIDWDARRVHRVPAPLQDDCAIGVMLR